MKLNQCCCFTPKLEASSFSSPRGKRQQPSRRKQKPVLDPVRKGVLEQHLQALRWMIWGWGSWRTWAAKQPQCSWDCEGSRALLATDPSPLLSLERASGQGRMEVILNMGLLQQMVVMDLPAHRQSLWQGRGPCGLEELQERANPASQSCPVSGALWAGVEPPAQNPYMSANCTDPSHCHHCPWGLGQGWTHPNTAVWHRADKSGPKGPIYFHDHQIQLRSTAQVQIFNHSKPYSPAGAVTGCVCGQGNLWERI